MGGGIGGGGIGRGGIGGGGFGMGGIGGDDITFQCTHRVTPLKINKFKESSI